MFSLRFCARHMSGFLWLGLVLWTNGVNASDPNLGSGQYRLVGAAFDVQPVAQTVPVDSRVNPAR